MDIQMSPVNGSKVGENGSSVLDINEKSLSQPNLVINPDFDPTMYGIISLYLVAFSSLGYIL